MHRSATNTYRTGQEMTNQRGYILTLSLMILTVIIIITNTVFNQGMSYRLISNTMINQKKARALALSGIQLAYSQLITQTGEQKNNPKLMLEKIIPLINRLQTITLKESIDGIEGTIQIRIGCESGKININHLYDFKNKKWKGQDQEKGDMHALIKDLCNRIEQTTKTKNLFESLTAYLQTRQRPLDDITELLMIKEWAPFRESIFYSPNGAKKIYLTDLFTVLAGPQVEPWLLCDSWCIVFNFARLGTEKKDVLQKRCTELLSRYQSGQSLSLLPSLYNQDFTSLPKDINSLWNTSFAATNFSVFCCGTSGGIRQSLYALIEKRNDGSESDSFVVKRVYWI